ncbi:hypothetical protein EON67_04880 [archaeon]|nr:MAG: hypothetical protein EON67_04880 [archaeon]
MPAPAPAFMAGQLRACHGLAFVCTCRVSALLCVRAHRRQRCRHYPVLLCAPRRGMQISTPGSQFKPADLGLPPEFKLTSFSKLKG